MSTDEPKDVRAIMLETDLVEKALRKAVTEALIRHKRLGTPIVVWHKLTSRVISIPGRGNRDP